MNPTYDVAERLLELPDQHQALLAEYDYFPAHNLLYVRWHGHLTAQAMVAGAQAGLDLFRERAPLRRILSDHSQVSGDWADALPWLHYEWLPQALAHGVELVAHVLPTDPSQFLKDMPGGPEFIEALRQGLLTSSFRNVSAAWHWATTR